MSNYLLHNMGCPPRSFVNYSFYKVSDKYIIISPFTLANGLHCHINDVYEQLNTYIKLHKDEIDKYLIDEYIIVNAVANDWPYQQGHHDNSTLLMKEYNVTTTPNINLLISLLGRIVGDLYIPNRDIEIDKDKLKMSYIVPMENN